ncbi:MAG: hypothetical protein J6B85_13585 [Lachnospiraceae bacterium]|nr:hypothetical protein [Lachnospiraceae bacterium]
MGRRRRRRHRGTGYGLSYGGRRENGRTVWKTIAAVLCVIVLAAGLGAGAYQLSKNNLAERKRVIPAPENIKEAILEQAGPKEETMEEIRSLFLRTGIAPEDWQERVELSCSKIEPEEIRVIWMEDFVDTRTPVEAKGIYVTASRAQLDIDSLIELVDRTELNAMVIDIKDDDGRVTYEMDYDMA